MSFKTKLIVFLVGLVVILLSLILIVSIQQTSEILEENEITKSELELNGTYSAFNELMKSITQSYVTLVYDSSLHHGLENEYSNYNNTQIRKALNTSTLLSEHIDSLAVYSIKHNYVVSTTGYGSASNCSEFTYNFFDQLRDKNMESVWVRTQKNCYFKNSQGTYCFSFFAPIYSRKSYDSKYEKIGYLIINVDYERILSTIKQNCANTDIVISFYNRYNDFLISNKNIESMLHTQEISYLFQNESGQININDIDYLYFVKKDTSEKYYYSVLLKPYDIITNKLNELRNTILLIGLIVLIMLIPVFFFVYRAIYKPIGITIKHMKLLEVSENFNVSIPYTRKDEFGKIFIEFNKMTEKIRFLIDELYRKNLLLSESRFKLLQSQINPHFLYNALNTISCMAIQEKNYAVSDAIGDLSDFMTLSLNKGQSMITIEDSIEQIKKYISLQTLRFKDKINIHFNITPSIKDYLLPTLLLQPLVENAIVHGMPDEYPLNINIEADFYNIDHISIVVANNGNPIAPERLALIETMLHHQRVPSDSFYALDNINERIKVTYGDNYQLTIKNNSPTGTICTIILPYDEKYLKRRTP